MNFGSVLSKHRAAIMGIAAIWIVCFHAYWDNGIWLWKLIVNRFGNVGVDIFVFIGGFGLAFSLNKDVDFYRFYRRRVERVLPPYYTALFLMLALYLSQGIFNLRWILTNFIPLGFWAGIEGEFWYVPAVLVYYALAPIFYFAIKKSRFPRIMLIMLMVLTGWLIPSFSNINPKAALRIPALVMGIGMGIFQMKHIKKKDRIMDFLIIIAAFGIGILAYCSTVLLNNPLFAMLNFDALNRLRRNLAAPFIAIMIAYLLEISSKTPVCFINKVLERLGKYSLEIYLSHLIIRGLSRHLAHLDEFGQLIAMLVFSYPLAISISWLGNKLLAVCKKLPVFKPAEIEE